MWWCTVRDGITPNLDGNMSQHGHFWLTCELPWNNRSLDGERHLWIAELPGNITATAGFQGTVCEPGASTDILRVIRNQKHPNAKILDEARKEYERQVSKLIADLRHKDFEDLIDQILLKTGWTRLGKLGGVTEGIDLEVQNQISSEIAFVQVKGSATQAILDNYIQRFSERRSRYKRMIFAVHSPKGTLTVSEKLPVHVWTGQKLAEMVVDLGLVNFVMTRTN